MVKAGELDAGEHRRGQRDAGGALDLSPAADHTAGRAPDEQCRAEARRDELRQARIVLVVVRGYEGHDQGGRPRRESSLDLRAGVCDRALEMRLH